VSSHHHSQSSPSDNLNPPREPRTTGESRQAPPIDRRDSQVPHRGATAPAENLASAGSQAITGSSQKTHGKLNSMLKEEICRLIADGHTLFDVAGIVGVSRSAIYRERRRDPQFKMQLSQKRHSIAHLCLNTMHDAAAKKWQAAERFFKLVYPDRYHYRPRMISEKQHEKVLAEMIKIFSSVATPEQMLKLDRLFNSPGKPRMPEVQT
jgi:hypothetical protein